MRLCRGRTCPARSLPASARPPYTAGPGMPGPYGTATIKKRLFSKQKKRGPLCLGAARDVLM